MAKTFGNTWWGQRWLNSLSKIDFDNRLPRGRRYANNGSVKSIEVKKNVVSAKVQGSRPTPYKVSIEVPVFSAEQKKWLKEEIRKHAQVHAALLNHELSPDIEAIAKSHSIDLFPAKWSDLAMSCSCPDWAVPCKHIAAVIYTLADTIDRNPWQLFQLKGLDLEKEFGKELGAGSDAIGYHTQETLFPGVVTALKVVPPQKMDLAIRGLDFSKVPWLQDSIYKLLSPSPLFWSQDFREEMDDRISLMVRNLKRWQDRQGQGDTLPEMRRGHAAQIVLSQDLEPDRVVLGSQQKGQLLSVSPGAFIEALMGIAAHELDELHPTVEGLWHVLNYSMALAAKGAIRPQLVQVRENGFRIIWLPAASAEAIARLNAALHAALPPSLCVWERGTGKTAEKVGPAADKALQLLCSFFLGLIVGEFSFDMPEYYQQRRKEFDPPVPTRDAIIDLFFGGMTVGFSGFGSEGIPQAIQKWLATFEIAVKTWKPVLQLKEKGSHFTVHLAAETESKGKITHLELKEFLEDKKLANDRGAFLKSLNQLAGLIPEVNQVLQSGGNKEVKADPRELLALLMDRLPLIELLGVQVLLPKALRELVRPKPTVKLKATPQGDDGFFNLDSLLSFDWQISLGEEQMNPSEFFKLVNVTHGLVKIKNRYILIQPDELEKLRKRIERGPAPSQQQLIQAALSGQFEGNTAGLPPEVLLLVNEVTQIQSMPVPLGLTATLRPYQQRGFEWMYKNARLGLGSLIADDMGLGKTLQVIALLEKFREEGKLAKMPALAVVPTSLVTNWKKETEKFAPELKTVIFHGAERKFPRGKFDLMVTTYGTLRSDLPNIKKKKWSTLIIDEAQAIKNADTAQSKSVREIPARIRIAMSGTPVENRLSDYWSIFDFALPGYLGSPSQFRDQFSVPITRFRDPEALDLFKVITGPFVMRRLKTDPSIISDLPKKLVNNAWCGLEKKQAAMYESVVRECLDDIKGAEAGIQRRGLVLKMLTSLKQVCNHPAQYLGKGGIDSAQSGKAAALMGILENISSLHEKVLIFTQYREMGEMLVKMIKKEAGQDALFLHGGLSRKKRDEMVASFQEDAHQKVFILSLKAGGTGLNLTAANHVVHYDLWWNPAVENQATDRAFRIGQKKNVLVHRILCKGTLEEKIDDMLNSKKELAEITVSQGETWIGDLSDNDLQKMVTLEM